MKDLLCPNPSSRFALQTVAMTKTTGPTKRFSGFRSTSGALLALVLSGAVIAAGGGVASASSKASTKKLSATSIKKFDSCMKKHGVAIPTFGGGTPPTGGASGSNPPAGFSGGSNSFSNPKSKAALKACSKYLPKGSQFGGGTGASSTAFAAYRNCMTLHHVTLPKGTPGSAPSAGSSVTSNPNYKKANAACSSLLPKATPKG